MTTTINGTNGIDKVQDGTIQSADFAAGVPGRSNLPAGTVLQVVQGTLSGSVSSGSASYVDTGLTASITPTSATSKILVTVFHPVPMKAATNTDVNLQVVRTAPTSSTLLSWGDSLYSSTATGYGTTIGGTYLDSPATTSVCTYKTVFCNGQGATGTVYIQTGGTGVMILMEIAA